MTDRTQLLDQIKSLNPVQYEEMLFCIEAPIEYLPSKDSPLVKQAIELLRYAEQRPDILRRLQDRLDSWFRPADEVENSAGNLVYFLADRAVQESRLRAALKQWQQQDSKPLACIFHGREDQHECFVERVLEHSLRNHAGLRQQAKQLYLLNSGGPLRLEYLERLEHLPQQLDACLEKAGIAAKLRREYERRPALYFEMDNREWHGSAECNTVTEFIRYWSKSALIQECKYPPLIFLGFQVMPLSPTPLLTWLSRRAKQAALMNWLASQARLDSVAFHGLPGVVLPELQGIPYADAIHWAGDIKSLHPRFKTHEPALKWHIQNRLYSNKKELPMRELGVALAQFCSQLS